MNMCTLLLAATISLSALPPAEYDDTEVVTNAALPAVRADTQVFSFRIELDATPSNCVEVAFGCDDDGDGVLSRHEEALIVGWDCGGRKVVDCATGVELCEAGAAGHAFLSFRVRIGDGGAPSSFEATAGGSAVFAALGANPPRFLYSPEWDTVRVVCRGMDSPSPSISGSIENIPLGIRIR